MRLWKPAEAAERGSLVRLTQAGARLSDEDVRMIGGDG